MLKQEFMAYFVIWVVLTLILTPVFHFVEGLGWLVSLGSGALTSLLVTAAVCFCPHILD